MFKTRMACAYNKKVKPMNFNEGDLVLKKILSLKEDLHGKFKHHYEGPYLVNKLLAGGALILLETDGDVLPEPFNFDSVKDYFLRFILPFSS